MTHNASVLFTDGAYSREVRRFGVFSEAFCVIISRLYLAILAAKALYQTRKIDPRSFVHLVIDAQLRL